MIDPDATWRTVTAAFVTPRERGLAALELLAHLAMHGELAFTPDERTVRAEVCKAVLTAELDSYQSLLLRMENR